MATDARARATAVLFGALTVLSLAGNAAASPDTTRYHTYRRMCHELDSLAARFPQILKLETLAVTPTGGRALVAARVSDHPGLWENKPAVFFNGVHHGCEFIGTEICLSLLSSLLSGYATPAGKRLVDSLQVTILPMVNPDGHEVNIGGADTMWRKNTRDNNGNGRFDPGDGVDLNRNYPFLWDSGGGAIPADREYRGPLPLSEVETQALTSLAVRERFVAEICYHSDQDSIQGDKVIYPWSWNGVHSPDYQFIRPIADSLAANIIGDDGSSHFTPEIGYATSGGMFRNWVYYTCGTFSHTVEVSRGYYPPAARVDSICTRNLAGAYYLLNRVLGSGIWVSVIDSLTARPLAATVALLEADTGSTRPILPHRSDSTFGRSYRLVTPGTYHVSVSCPGYHPKTAGPIAVVAGLPTRVAVALAPGTPGWMQKSSMPAGAKLIKDGGWLAYDAGKTRIYASRGNRQPDFFSYNPVNDSWKALAPWPTGTEGKLPGKGSVGCADGNGVIYATKGNNKQGFWKYDAAANAWTQVKDVPLGPSNKKVKGGTDIVWAYRGGIGYAYLLKGYKNEFWRYDPAADFWSQLPDAPVGVYLKWDNGSWLAYDGDKTIYAHKAGHHEFWKYDTEKDSWSPTALLAMPISGSAGSKKSKDGGCGTYLDAAIYALKGGNTQEFWKYTVSSNSWAEKETIPRGTFKKKVKAGGDIVTAGTDLYAIKGNKSNDFWMYTPGAFVFAVPRRDGVVAERLAIDDCRLAISPNPLASGFVMVRFSSPLRSPVTLAIYNAAGRLVHSSFGIRTSSFRLDLRSMPAGVYLVKLSSEGFASSQKLVVQR